MSLTLAYPSVPSFPQSSILLKESEGRDSTPTETALGVLMIAAAQNWDTRGAPHGGVHNVHGIKSSAGR